MHDFFGLFETRRKGQIEHEEPVSTMKDLLDTWSLTKKKNAQLGRGHPPEVRNVLRSSVVHFPNRKNEVYFTY